MNWFWFNERLIEYYYNKLIKSLCNHFQYYVRFVVVKAWDNKKIYDKYFMSLDAFFVFDSFSFKKCWLVFIVCYIAKFIIDLINLEDASKICYQYTIIVDVLYIIVTKDYIFIYWVRNILKIL